MARRARVVIIGAGTAGLTALAEARRWTEDVLLIQHGPYGTTCARVGCMPSKALLAVAHGRRALRHLGAAGVRGVEGAEVDHAALMGHVRAHRDRLSAGPARQAQGLGERSLYGRPRFIDPHTLELDGERIEAEATIIATGTEPVVPEPWRALGDRVATSETFFERTHLGRRAAVVGLGPIGVELGQGLAELGVEVHAFQRGERVAGLSDPVVNDALLDALRGEMAVTTGATVELEDAGAAGVRVRAGEAAVEVDWVLAALGRRPSLDGLGLDALPGALDGSGAPALDPQTLRLGDLPIFLAGDVSGQRPLMHEAADEGRLAAYHALHAAPEPLERRTPLGIVFTAPQAARVGLSWEELPEDGWVQGSADFGRQSRAQLEGRHEGRLHLYADTGSGRLLGAEMAVPDGEHLAHLLAWSIQRGATLDELLEMPYYHPCTEEGLRTAVQSARKQLGPRRPQPDLPRRPGGASG